MSGITLSFGFMAQKFMNKPDFSSPNHTHAFYEFLFIRHASFNYLVGESIVVPTDYSIVLINTNTVHKAIRADSDKNSYLIFQFYENMVDPQMRDSVQRLFCNPLLILSEEDASLIEFLLLKLYQEYSEKRDDCRNVSYHLLNVILMYLCRDSTHRKLPSSISTPSVVEQIIVYLNHNLFKSDSPDLSLQSVAMYFGLNPSTLSRRFKLEVGMGFKQYIISLRIAHAKKLLTSTNMSITDIAFCCGFSDSNYFSYVFKKMESITPTEYVQIARETLL